MGRPVLVVHGGAGTIPQQVRDAAQAGVAHAVTGGFELLQAKGSALDAAVRAVELLEADPTYNAGHGACMNVHGQFEVDASVMSAPADGSTPRHGALAAVRDLANPVVTARAVMEHSPHALLAGQGAREFAEAHGGRFDRDALWTAKAQARWDAVVAGEGTATAQADTVGAVALDADGGLAVACSTGGVLHKAVGRVGDSPLVGVGFYADAQLGAACATGVGEAIMTRVASYAVLQRIAGGEDPQTAADAVCRLAAGEAATCGLIIVLPDGRPIAAHHSPHMSWAVARADAPVHAAIQV